MIYVADKKLSEAFETNKLTLIRNFGFAVIAAVFLILRRYPLKITPIPIIAIVSLIFITIIIVYVRQQIIKPGLMVNKTASLVTLLPDEIIIKTFDFNILFWINRPSLEMKFKINEIKIKKTLNPIKPYFKMDSRIFTISDHEKEAYIMVFYFSGELDEKLTQIMEEVMPASTIIPGRLRHY